MKGARRVAMAAFAFAFAESLAHERSPAGRFWREYEE
jgi:hypothetical protein